jgi:hypothetical protein
MKYFWLLLYNVILACMTFSFYGIFLLEKNNIIRIVVVLISIIMLTLMFYILICLLRE